MLMWIQYFELTVVASLVFYCFSLTANNFRIIYLKRKAKHCLNGWERCRSLRRKCKRRSLNELFTESSGQKMYKRESSSSYSIRSREDFRIWAKAFAKWRNYVQILFTLCCDICKRGGGKGAVNIVLLIRFFTKWKCRVEHIFLRNIQFVP